LLGRRCPPSRAGDVAFLVSHHPHVLVGDIRPRLGVVAVGARLLRWPQAPRLARRGGRIPRLDLGPLRITAGPVLRRPPRPCPGRPTGPGPGPAARAARPAGPASEALAPGRARPTAHRRRRRARPPRRAASRSAAASGSPPGPRYQPTWCRPG